MVERRPWPSATPEQMALVESHTARTRALVWTLARKWRLTPTMAEEVQVAAFEGLWLAALRWDVRREFWLYARGYVKGFVKIWIRDSARIGLARRAALNRRGMFVPYTISLDAKLDRAPEDGVAWQIEDVRSSMAIQRAELRKQVEGLLSLLAPAERELLQRRYLDGVRFRELGRAYGVSAPCIRARIKAVLKRLQRRAVRVSLGARTSTPI